MGSKIHLKRISLNGVRYHRTPKVHKLRTEVYAYLQDNRKYSKCKARSQTLNLSPNEVNCKFAINFLGVPGLCCKHRWEKK